MKKTERKNILIIGFAIFAMFFGAGNLIFPPCLGLMNGKSWFLSFLCFILMDIGLSLLTLLVVTRIGRGTEGITEKLGRLPSILILSLNAICLGPLIAIPRTAATAYEFSVAPFFPSFDTKIFSLVFFLVVVLFCLRQSKVIDIIGTFFAPLILAALLFLIIKGIVSPLGAIELESAAHAAVRDGLNAGYQTMDVMAAMIFSASILLTIKQKGYKDTRSQFKIISASGLLATLILFVVYGGLAYLGATVCAQFPADIDRVALLIAIVKALLGEKGMVLLGALVCAACLTPAIGLLSSSASFFEKQTKGRISYRAFVFGFAGISYVISNFGITRILALASPILNILYPVLVLLVFMGLAEKWLPNTAVYRLAAFGTIVVSTLSTVSAYLPVPVNIAALPLYEYGFQWVLPAAAFGLTGYILTKEKPARGRRIFGNIVVRT